MDVLCIEGPARLCGRVDVSGSKNAALPIIAAALLVDGPVTLSNVPRLGDVETLASVLGSLGVAVERTEPQRLAIETVDRRLHCAAYRFVRRMRASFCVLGPLVARRGRAVVSLPGGCRLGPRPVDLHLRGLAALGADISLRRGYVVAQAKRLRGARIDLSGPRGPTVTGTANVLSAAVLAQGSTEIFGAACEPEIVDLGRFLIQCGARIEGLGTSRLFVQGVPELGGANYRVMPDRIEAATWLIAAAVAGERVEVAGLRQNDLAAVLDLLVACGVALDASDDSVIARRHAPLQAFRATTGPYPRLPTDVQPLLSVLALGARGTSTIGETVFPERFGHVAELARLGANMRRRGSVVRVRGEARLVATTVAAPDLRAAAALALAGLTARGTTTLEGVGHLERGYETFEAKLASLGAPVSRQSRHMAHDYPASVISRPSAS